MRKGKGPRPAAAVRRKMPAENPSQETRVIGGIRWPDPGAHGRAQNAIAREDALRFGFADAGRRVRAGGDVLGNVSEHVFAALDVCRKK